MCFAKRFVKKSNFHLIPRGHDRAHRDRLPRIPSLYWLHTVVQCPAPCPASLLVTSSLFWGPYYGRNRHAGLASFESSTLATTSALRLASSEKLAIAVLLARQGEGFRAGSFCNAYRTGQTSRYLADRYSKYSHRIENGAAAAPHDSAVGRGVFCPSSGT